MSTANAAGARIDFRTTPDVKALIEQAAALNGTTVSEFIKMTMIDRSREVIERDEARVLSAQDRDILISLLEQPPAPNAALQEAARKFKGAVKSGALTL